MGIITKIKVYSIISWILIGLTILLAIYEQIRVQEFNILGFLTGMLFQPYLWIALILIRRIKENKKRLMKG